MIKIFFIKLLLSYSDKLSSTIIIWSNTFDLFSFSIWSSVLNIASIYNKLEYKKEELKEHYIDKSEKNIWNFVYIFVKQRKKVDKSITLYSFEGPFELLHEDIVNIRLVAKSGRSKIQCASNWLIYFKKYIRKTQAFWLEKLAVLWGHK